MSKWDRNLKQPTPHDFHEAIGVYEAEPIHLEIDPIAFGRYTVNSSNFEIRSELDEVSKELVPCLKWIEGSGQYGTVPPDQNPLPKFLLLANAEDDQILQFVKRYGALGVYPTILETRDRLSRFQIPMREPLDFYRNMAQQFDALLRLTDDQEKLEYPAVNNWRLIDAEVASWGLPKEQNAAERQLFVRKVLSKWWKIARPVLTPALGPGAKHGYDLECFCQREQVLWDWGQIRWQERKMPEPFKHVRVPLTIARHESLRLPSLGQRPSELFTILVVQLSSVITSPQGVRHCSACNRLIEGRTKKPARTKAAYCDSEVCQAEAARKRSKSFYDKKNDKKNGPAQV